MTDGYAVKGWCPGAHRPMPSGDGLVVRVRVPLGRLAPAQASGLARAALAHGSGEIDLSGRANLQLRGVTAASHPDLLGDLARLGLLDADPAVEARRNLAITPFWPENSDTPALAAAIEAGLRQAPPLPGKFGAVLDHGPLRVMASIPGDIRIEADGSGGLILRADGAAHGRRVAPPDLAEAVAELAHWFVAAGGIRDGRGRMAALIASGAELPPALAGEAAPAPAVTPPGPGLHPAGFFVALEFGRLRAETLLDLAEYPLRLTPWRLILAEGATAAPAGDGLIFDAGDPRLRVVACPGAPGCWQALAPVRDLARVLAPRVPPGACLHLSACAKGCAHPAPADVTLTAQAEGFALIRPGRAGDAPIRTGLSAETLLGTPALPFETP